MATKYQKRMMMRKGSDLTRLAEQFKKNIETSTGEYESAFSAYQKQREEAMAPYEVASKEYREIQMPAYESAKAAYEERLNKFNEALSNFQSKTKVSAPFKLGGDLLKGTVEQIWNIDGGKISSNKLPSGYSIEVAPKGTKDRFYDLYKDNPVPTFSERAPSAPSAPQAPQIAGFDETKFEQKRGQIQQEFQREVGERKGARLAVVGRRGSRPLMQDK
jgi:hypothetical protein